MVYITPHKMNTLLRQPTAFEKYLEREKMSAEQAVKSAHGRKWIQKHAGKCFIPEHIIKAAGADDPSFSADIIAIDSEDGK